MFSVGTDLPQKPPSKPNSHDLGLLREKCRYERCARKAERMVLMKDGTTTTTTATTPTTIDVDATANDSIVATIIFQHRWSQPTMNYT